MRISKFFVPQNYIVAAKTFAASRRCPYAYVVAGLGRCGTTLMYDALRRSVCLKPNKTFLVNFNDSMSYKKGALYKTHDTPPDHLPSHVKVVFMFGNPMNAALSAYRGFDADGPDACKQHYEHMHSPHFLEHEDIVSKDTLLLADHFYAWHKQQSFSFASVRYESLWKDDVRSALEDYLETRLELPPARPRKADWTTHERREELLSTYGPLHVLMTQAEDVKIWSVSNTD